MDDTAIAVAVAALIAGRAEKRAIAGLPDGARPSTPAEAYAIQDALIPALLEQAGGGAVIGYKAGATNPAAMANFLLEEPFRGYLLSSLTHDSGVTLAPDACIAPVLECEFAFRMGDDLPAAAAPYDLDAVVGAVASVIIAIEVVDVRFSEGLAAGGLSRDSEKSFSQDCMTHGKVITSPLLRVRTVPTLRPGKPSSGRRKGC